MGLIFNRNSGDELAIDIDSKVIDGIVETLNGCIDLASSEEGIGQFDEIANTLEEEASGESKNSLILRNNFLKEVYQNDIDTVILYKDVMAKYREFLRNGPTGPLVQNQDIIKLDPSKMRKNFDEFSEVLSNKVPIIKDSSSTLEAAAKHESMLQSIIAAKESAEPPQDASDERRRLGNLQANRTSFNSMTLSEDHKLEDIKKRFLALDEPIDVFENQIKLFPKIWENYLKNKVEGRDTYIMDYIDDFDIEKAKAIYTKLKETDKVELLEDLSNYLGMDDEELLDKIKELQKQGLLDNVLANCIKQIGMMGKDEFLEDPKRLKWLLNHPRYKVNGFRTDLTPEQLRLLTEELPYLLFWQDSEGNVKFNKDFYKLLVGEYVDDIEDVPGFEYLDRFLNDESGLKFEAVINPDTGGPWYIDMGGLQGCVLKVNGEIIITFPGSQEGLEDNLKADLAANLIHGTPDQYYLAAGFVEDVREAFPDDNIILCGHSLAGGTVSYAGAVNDVNSFAIDPAPSKEGEQNSGYDKGITVIPGGKSDGLLNEPVVGSDGYYDSNTDIDLADAATKIPESVTKPGGAVAGGVIGWNMSDDNVVDKAVGTAGGAVAGTVVGGHLDEINAWGQSNDVPSNNESVYENTDSSGEGVNERNDCDDPNNKGFYDEQFSDGYGGDHLTGDLSDSGLNYGYVPYS